MTDKIDLYNERSSRRMKPAEIVEFLAGKVAEANDALEFGANMATAEAVLKGDKALHMRVIERALEIKPSLAFQYVELVNTIDAGSLGRVN